MVIGQREYDWVAFKAAATYDGEFDENHTTVELVGIA